MRERRPLAVGANAVVWAGTALLLAALTPQLGLAQQASAAEPDTRTTDAEVLSMPAGVLTSRAAYGNNPVARPTGSKASTTLSGVWYSGYDAARGAQYVFSGGTVALNGDLSRNGFFVRAYGSRVDYELDPGDGRGYQADLMLGYRVSQGKVYGGLYVGADYQNYRLDPDDPTAEVRGTEWGFKVAADLATLREGTSLYYALAGNYSTAFETYWARARVGVTLHRITFGPEAIALGDVGFDAQRVGGFVIMDFKPFPQSPPVEVTLHAGHQFVAGENGDPIVGGVAGGEGTYGGITFTLLF